jgi:hypothetical protein
MLESIAPKDRTGLATSDLLDVACIALTALAAVALATNEHSFARSVAALIFVIFVPGRAIVSNWPEIAVQSVTAVSILFSLALNTLVATVAVWAHVWHPAGMIEVECALAIAALIVAILRRHSTAGQQTPALGEIEQAP